MVRRTLISTDDLDARSAAAPEAPEMRHASTVAEDIDIVSERDAAYIAQQAKFMEEKVVIFIEMDDEPNAPVFIPLGHNGSMQYVQRGTEQTVKRKYLYSALAAKVVRFASNFGKRADGNAYNEMNPNVKTTYRVSLVRDDNPQGGPRWVQQVMQAA